MSPRLIALAACLVASGVAVGLFEAGRDPAAAASEAVVTWTEPVAPVDYSRAAAQFMHTLEGSGVFPIPPAAPTEAAAAAAPEPSSTFPVILSVALVDGRPHAYLRDAGGGRITAEPGVELAGGWKVVSVSLEAIVAEREGETFTFEVYPRTGGQ